MTKIALKYGKGQFEIDVPEKNLAGIILPNELSGVHDEQAEIRRALDNPIGSQKLREKVKPGMRVAIIISDVTRPVPSYKFLPTLLDEINAGGVLDRDIAIVVALGSHRNTTEEERKALAGKAYDRVRCIDMDRNNCTRVGTSSFGHPIESTAASWKPTSWSAPATSSTITSRDIPAARRQSCPAAPVMIRSRTTMP
jgi:nickel-dependent lactate racemase